MLTASWYGLWDAGDIHHALVEHRIPFASVLKNTAGTERLLIERPGHRSGYLLGALTAHEKEDSHNDPTTPHSIVLPADLGLAAHAVAHTFLPAYRRALHHRDLNTVLTALERIREQQQALKAIKDSGPYSDGNPLSDSDLIAGMERDFAEWAWLSFTQVLEHAPLLLARCHPTATPWPQDTATLTRLREASPTARTLRTSGTTPGTTCTRSPGRWPPTNGARSGAASASPCCPPSRPGSPTAKRSSARPAPPYRAARQPRPPSPRQLTTRPAAPPTPPAASEHR
ncbi:hypothetical protein ABZ896_38000 [Streptomyces sp. NPDC047072]|uniref:hypothetical protein n=1 Tax=Streptomyces sp. NPDC047072 TaxID=3154809 RepID=UPI0033C5DDF5